jgi:hypothetical protein
MKNAYSTEVLCEAFCVSRSGFYDWLERRSNPGTRAKVHWGIWPRRSSKTWQANLVTTYQKTALESPKPSRWGSAVAYDVPTSSRPQPGFVAIQPIAIFPRFARERFGTHFCCVIGYAAPADLILNGCASISCLRLLLKRPKSPPPPG